MTIEKKAGISVRENVPTLFADIPVETDAMLEADR